MILNTCFNFKILCPKCLNVLNDKVPYSVSPTCVSTSIFQFFPFVYSKMVILCLNIYIYILPSFLPSISLFLNPLPGLSFQSLYKIPSNANCSKKLFLNTLPTVLSLLLINHLMHKLVLASLRPCLLYFIQYMMCSSCAVTPYLPHLDSELPEGSGFCSLFLQSCFGCNGSNNICLIK